MIRHVQMTVEWALLMTYETTKDGGPILEPKHLGFKTLNGLRRYLTDLRSEGFEVVPACENYDKTGRCLGHPHREDLPQETVLDRMEQIEGTYR
jgi:hypothetical protein